MIANLVERSVRFDNLGEVRIVATSSALVAIYFEEHRKPVLHEAQRLGARSHDVVDLAEAQLREYCLGRRRSFSIKLVASGTPFQRDVWNALLAIPYGETRTYMQIARILGKPGAVRAVGTANARNPHSIVVPCHRVVGSDGALTGYAGGLPRKRWLIELEARAPQTSQPPP
jgi:methylated-DNA-[protein]-cysteine S-methyltransferase